MNKRGYEFSFSWIFAIMIGAVVIFVAIYMTTQIIDTQRLGEQGERGRELATLFVPLETNLEQAKKAVISVPSETKLVNDCTTATSFGTQIIGTYVRSGIGEEWDETSATVRTEFHNKYLFSEKEVYGRQNFYVLSKPFKYPYKIADVMIVYGDATNYCFVNTWSEVKEELGDDLNLTNVKFVDTTSACDPQSKKVCFNGDSSCEIQIKRTAISKQVVHKDIGTVTYDDSFDGNDKYALLYAAIFSHPDIYNCQVNRLLSRTNQIASIYIQKSDYITQKGCRSSPLLPSALNAYQNKIEAAKNTNNIGLVFEEAKSLEDKNAALNCRLF